MTVSLKSAIQRNKAGTDSVAYGRLLLILCITLAILGLLYWARVSGWPYQWLFRYLCILPVVLIAYHYGLTAGLIGAIFFTTLFIPELIWLWRWNRISVPVIELLAFIVFIYVLAYLVADSTQALRAQEELAIAVRDSRSLLTRAPDFDQVIDYLLREGQRIGNSRQAALLLRNPLDEHWDLITDAQRLPISLGSTRGEQTSLAAWLVKQCSNTINLDNLSYDPRFGLPPANGAEPVQSLLAMALRQSSGQKAALLVLLDSSDGYFGPTAIAKLRALVNDGEKALEYADRYARTDQALARRVAQLGAIERTARQINATLDPQQILQQTLVCALDITGGDAGLVVVSADGLPPMICSHNMPDPAPDVHQLLSEVQYLDRAVVVTATGSEFPGLAPAADYRWLAPIVHQRQVLGCVLVDQLTPLSGQDTSLQALSSLASHVAIALENVRLFRKIEAEKRKAKLIVDTVADGLLTVDAQGCVLSLNPAAEQLTGWRNEEAAGKLVCEVIGCPQGERCDRTCTLFAALAQTRTLQEDHWVIRQRRGTQRVVSLSAAPLQVNNGESEGLVVRFRDITEEQEIERLQQDLIAGFSHELRTPLAYINTVAEMMLAEESGAPGRRFEYLNILVAQSKRLARFADKLLDVSQLESGSRVLEPRPLPVDLAVESIVQQWRSSFPRRTLTLHKPDQPLWAWADESAVETVLNGLIDNALKYARDQSAITVSIEPGSDQFVQVCVEDEGPGISPQHQDRVFDRFYRVHAADDQKVYGYGLGLWVARELVQAMGGQIWVTSEVGAYCRFTFTLPLMIGDDDE